MSSDSRSQRKDSEQYYYESEDAHTAMPDWVPFARQLTAEARNLIMATLVLQKLGVAPTRLELATALHVDARSVYRWLAEISTAGALSTRRNGHRKVIVFHKPKPDRPISDRPISDRPISDRPIRFDDSGDSAHACQQSHETAKPDRMISDPTVGGGGSLFGESDPPTIHRTRAKVSPQEITQPTGIWMVAEGFSILYAHKFQALPLVPVQADYQRRRQLGQGHGAIALAWNVAPPAGDSSVAPLMPSAGEFSFSENEKKRYRDMGFAIGDEIPESEEST